MKKKTYELTNLEIQFIAGALIEYKNHWDPYSFNPTLDKLVKMFHEVIPGVIEDSQMEEKQNNKHP